MADRSVPETIADPTGRPGPIKSGLPFPVVGIGASAGGLLAIRRFLEHLPSDNGMAFVVVLHLSPRHESQADRILQRATRMRVIQVTATTAIVPNQVYVISPNLDLSMNDGHLAVTTAARPRGGLVAIDLFFRTLAETHRDRSIGIVMSGTGADGTLGVARLKEQGGVTLAQSPGDSEFEEMPKNAISSGNVDFVLPAADMPQKLVDLWANARAIRLPDAKRLKPPLSAGDDPRPATESALREIIDIVNARTGHDFTSYKRATLLRRMERRMQVRMLKDLPSYRDYLRTHVDETRSLLADLLISVTNFFRDREAYDALERIIVPGLFVDRDPAEPVRVWVAGCATGEEAFSLAMLLQDEVSRLGSAHQFQVFASDIDEKAVAIARRALYPTSIVADVPPARLRTYFTLEGGHYRVKKALRERVLFAPHNALRDPPFSRLDLVSCRNVLIYLERDIQQKLLQMFHYALRRGGTLFLGSSESADSAEGLYETVDKRQRIYRAADVDRKRPFRLPLRVSSSLVRGPDGPASPPAAATPAAAVHQRVLELYAPPSVIVDAAGDVVHMSEHAARFLRVSAGVPSHQLLALIRPELRQELRSALFQATHTQKSVESRRVQFERDARFYYLNMIVRPFTDPGSGLAHALVLFEEVEDTMSAGDGDSAGVPEKHSIALQLEHELQQTRERLQTTVELAETSSQDLKASNEELQAINEELRSASEELETSTEELQSVNEELITVNAELKSKVEETERANDDLKNFMAATDVATIFLDAGLAIKRYTPQAEALFSVISTDIGRPLTDITHRLHYPTLAEDAETAVAGQQLVEREVTSSDGRWWVVRMRPYVTAQHEAGGAVLTFVDITGLRIAEEHAARSGDDIRAALQQSRDFAAIVIAADGCITGWNEGAERTFGHDAGEALGRPFAMIFVPEDVAAGMPGHEMRTALETGRAEDERWHLRKDGSRVFCSGVLTALAGDGSAGFVKIVRDVTSQQRGIQTSRRELKRARARRDDAEAAAALKDEFLAVMSHELKHPLNLISVNSEILARSPGIGVQHSPAAGKALRTISRAIRTQTKIIDDLLDLSRIRTGKLALDCIAMDLVPLVELAAETAGADAATSEIELSFQASEPHVVVLGDPARINQIVWNLLSNAIKFTPAGGRVRVRVDIDAAFGRIEVSDTGIGIERTALSRIFEMFGQARARASSTQGGLGIGLSLVRQLAEHHGGRVEGESAGPGQGARFTVWLPLYVEAAVPGVGHASAVTPDCCSGLTILVVDDDPATVEALATLLELEGAAVQRARSAAEALACLDGERPDVVVTDLGMPHQDGFALLQAIRARSDGAGLPVVALTGFGRPDDVQRTVEAGFDAHLGKPVEFGRLLDLIATLTARGAMP